ncbi:hypothetical protein [Thermomonas sp.]|uniref:hypothetical protein n=1 Tax=Thermomonas sp. TaxID=1971895 RepID=UPI0035B456BA
MRVAVPLAVVPLLLCMPLAAWAQDTVFYKCTDAKGQVSMQNGVPCAAGMKQEVRRVGTVQTAPAPARKPVQDTPPAAPPQYGEFVLVSGPAARRRPAVEAAGLPPPPPLYQCRTWDGATYDGDTATPPSRCVPLQVVGLDGSAGGELSAACEVKQDTCTEVPAAQLCTAWYRRLDEADFKRRYADAHDLPARDAAHAAIAATIKASRCATEVPPPAAVP